MTKPPAGRRALLAALILWLATRAAAVVLAWPIHTSVDGANFYEPVATSLAEGSGFARAGVPTAFVGPVYPLFLAALHWAPRPAITFAQLGIDGLTAWLLCRLAVVSGAEPWIVLLLSGLYLPAARNVATVATETLFTFLQCGAVYSTMIAWDRPTIRRGAAGGALTSLAILCRPALAAPFVAALALPAIAWARTTRRTLVVFGVILVVPILAWMYRNAEVMGRPVLTTQLGSVLYLGVAGDGQDIAGATRFRKLYGEMKADSMYKAAALATIRAHPGRCLSMCATKASRFWIHLPDPRPLQWGNVGTIVFHSTVLVLAAAGMVFARRSRWVSFILVYAVGATVVHAITTAVVRYSQTLIPLLFIPAALALERLWAWARARVVRKTP